MNSVGSWVGKKKKKPLLSRYSSLIGIVFVNAVTLMPVSVNYAITFVRLEANLQILPGVFLRSENSVKILAENHGLGGG